MTLTDQLIEQIKSLPETTLHIRRANGGLGSVLIYTKHANGLKVDSVWLGRPHTEQLLQDYIASRAGGAA